MTGYIKLHRKIWDNPYSEDPLFLAIWVYILSHANHAPKEKLVNGKVMTINRGEYLGSISKIAGYFSISRMKVSRVLSVLQEAKQVNIKTTNKYTVFSITNYDLYQDREHQMNNKRTSDEQQMNTTKNVKNDKNIKEKNPRGFKKKADAFIPPAEYNYLIEQGLEPFKLNPQKTAAKLTHDWELCSAWGQWALTQGLDRDKVVRESEAFRDYFTSMNCKAANRYKVDWFATWKNWIRKGL